MAACDLAASPTATIVPTATATALPTATAVPTATPVTIDSVEIEIQVETVDGRIVADGRSESRVMALVHSPDAIVVEGLLLNFRVEGGGEMNPSNVPILSGQAESVYISGETGSETNVILTAILDVPNFGRKEARSSFTLVQQELSLETACPILLDPVSNTAQIPLTLRAEPAALGGIYGIFGQTDANDNVLLSQAGIPDTSFRALMEQGQSTVIFQRLQTSEMGASEVCFSLSERPLNPSVCTLVYWGDPVESLVVQAPDLSWRNLAVADFRFQQSGANAGTMAVWRYRSLLPSQNNHNIILNPLETPDEPRLQNNCYPQNLGFSRSVIYQGYHIPSESWLMGWELFTANQRQFGELIIARQAGLMPLGSIVNLTDTSSLLYERFDNNFRVYQLRAPEAEEVTMEVILRLFVPSEQVDENTGTIIQTENSLIAATSISAYYYYGLGNIALQNSSALIPAYISAEFSDTSNKRWRRVYVQGTLPITSFSLGRS